MQKFMYSDVMAHGCFAQGACGEHIGALHMGAHGCTWLCTWVAHRCIAHGCTWLHMVAHGCTWLHMVVGST